MANRFGTDILIQSPDPKAAAAFYVATLGFVIDEETDTLISLLGPSINLFIEKGTALAPVLEVHVDDVEVAKAKLVAAGGRILKDEPDFPRCYVQDPNGLIYNLAR
jgi:catechol 2,3-dioxygenase-like lactoylglutathione lyase family enzyme